MKLISKTAVVGVGLLVAYGAQAALLSTHQRTNNYSFSEGSTVFVPLNNGGATSVNFRTTANRQKIVVSYTAECGVLDNKHDTWLNLDIQVDGVTIAPTNTTADAFCSSTANTGYDWKMAAVNAVYVVPTAGTHNVRIRAAITAGNGGARGWLGDTSLVVWR